MIVVAVLFGALFLSGCVTTGITPEQLAQLGTVISQQAGNAAGAAAGAAAHDPLTNIVSGAVTVVVGLFAAMFQRKNFIARSEVGK